MRIIQLQAENIKRLKAVSITPRGDIVQITGPNGSGKTSVLDSIWYALAGTKEIPSQVVRQGQQSAVIRLNLGELIVTRDFDAAGNTRLSVNAKDGTRISSPQTLLDSILGELTFDPLAFTRMKPAQQLESLRGVVKLPIDLDEVDAVIHTAYDRRTEVNRKVESLDAQITAIKIPDPLPEKRDVPTLLREIEKASESNAEIAAQETVAATLKRRLRQISEQMADLERQQKDAQKRLSELEANKQEPKDISVLRKEIEKARDAETIHAKAEHRTQLRRQLTSTQKESDELTATIQDQQDKKADAISHARMPVKGLSFGDGQVLFNKLPFDQASSAEQLRVSVGIAMAANPKLRILRIQDGSLLDKDSLRLIAEMASDEDFQIWIERVDMSGKVGIVMEEGEVR